MKNKFSEKVLLPGVRNSSEFQRIHALPRFNLNNLSTETQQSLIEQQTRTFKTEKGTQTLRLIQAFFLLWAEEQAQKNQGMLCPMGVGSGKTLCTFLAGTVYQAKYTVLFTYASLVKRTYEMLEELRKHWKITSVFEVLSWESLSRKPVNEFSYPFARSQLIVCDEAHAVRNSLAARTKRFIQLVDQFPNAPLICLSGTLTTSSLKDFAHLARGTLGLEGCPLPCTYRDLEEWDAAVAFDSQLQRKAGILKTWFLPGETDTPQSRRQAVQRRIQDTVGVVATLDNTLPVGLNIYRDSRAVKLSETVKLGIERLQNYGVKLNDDEVESPAEIAREIKTLLCGYYLEWNFDTKPECTKNWYEARQQWAKACRNFLSLESVDPKFRELVSPGKLLESAHKQIFPTRELYEAFERWRWYCHITPPPTRCLWINSQLDSVAQFVSELANTDAIIWVNSPYLGEALATVLALPFFGSTNPENPENYKGFQSIICSMDVHGTGKNLQQFSKNIFVNCPSSAQKWEQLLGRTHRPGQQKDTVECVVLQHHEVLKKAFNNALEQAKYLQDTTGNQQKLLQATIVNA